LDYLKGNKRNNKYLKNRSGDCPSYQTNLNNDHSIDPDPRLKTLEAERNKLLLAEEERWRLKSRATWIQCGDKNTKYFHRFSSYRRNKKHLWEVKDESDQVHYGQEAIKDEVLRFFSSFYQDTGKNLIEDQIASVRLFPRMVSEEEVQLLEKPCTRGSSRSPKGFHQGQKSRSRRVDC
jgi:hypothetical protein